MAATGKPLVQALIPCDFCCTYSCLAMDTVSSSVQGVISVLGRMKELEMGTWTELRPVVQSLSEHIDEDESGEMERSASSFGARPSARRAEPAPEAGAEEVRHLCDLTIWHAATHSVSSHHLPKTRDKESHRGAPTSLDQKRQKERKEEEKEEEKKRQNNESNEEYRAVEYRQTLELLKEMLILADPNKSLRIPFLGSESQRWQAGSPMVVSFPGVHGLAWTFLTQLPSAMPTTCVFLPDATAAGYGDHVAIKHHPLRKCFCWELYGEVKQFGCKWYEIWMQNTHRAYFLGAKLVVVTKADGGLGNSQQAEVRFLEDCRYPYTIMSIGKFSADFLNKRISIETLDHIKEVLQRLG